MGQNIVASMRQTLFRIMRSMIGKLIDSIYTNIEAI